jgi:Tol biopolymer transport system component/DNA-binding winged helix-turn-helix (wHTH) protein
VAGSKEQRKRITFGPFEADCWSQEIRKQGVRLRIAGQPFQVLRMLLERQGELVTREELHKALWPSDTFVDFEHGLNAAVNKLRQVLSDDPENPRYIETVPRRGYRFIAKINATAEVSHSKNPLRAWPKIAAWTVVAATCLLASVVIYQRARARSDSPTATKIVPFTSYPGFELCPAFSPDGSRIAFAWNGDSALGYKDFDLYVKVIGSENLLRLTYQPSVGLCPTWSPDGTQIAFIRFSGRSNDAASVRVVPALGGPERELLSIPNGEGISMPPVWSPDGRWIVFGGSMHRGDPHWLHFLSVESLEVKEIAHAEGCVAENWVGFSHSRTQWAYLCLLKPEQQEFGIYRAPWPDGPPSSPATFVTRFTTDGQPGGIAWTPNDEKLLLSRPQSGTGHELDEVSLADGSLQKLSFGQDAEEFTISPTGNKLAFVVHPFRRIVIWRKDLLHPKTAPVSLAPSTRVQDDALYSPDGKHIAFTSFRGGLAEIWMSDPDGTNLAKLSDAKSADSGWPRWSSDSRKITFSSRHSGLWEVYIVDVAERLPRRVVTNVRGMLVSSWSHDGKWIYFQGDPDEKIYRCLATGGEAVALSSGSGFNPWESQDGKTLYFADRLNVASIKMVSLQTPGVESAVPGMPAILDAGSWTVVPRGIYFVPADAPKSLRYFDFAARQVRPVLNVSSKPFGDLSASPDGRWLLYTQLDEDNADIMLVEDFR